MCGNLSILLQEKPLPPVWNRNAKAFYFSCLTATQPSKHYATLLFSQIHRLDFPWYYCQPGRFVFVYLHIRVARFYHHFPIHHDDAPLIGSALHGAITAHGAFDVSVN